MLKQMYAQYLTRIALEPQIKSRLSPVLGKIQANEYKCPIDNAYPSNTKSNKLYMGVSKNVTTQTANKEINCVIAKHNINAVQLSFCTNNSYKLHSVENTMQSMENTMHSVKNTIQLMENTMYPNVHHLKTHDVKIGGYAPPNTNIAFDIRSSTRKYLGDQIIQQMNFISTFNGESYIIKPGYISMIDKTFHQNKSLINCAFYNMLDNIKHIVDRTHNLNTKCVLELNVGTTETIFKDLFEFSIFYTSLLNLLPTYQKNCIKLSVDTANISMWECSQYNIVYEKDAIDIVNLLDNKFGLENIKVICLNNFYDQKQNAFIDTTHGGLTYIIKTAIQYAIPLILDPDDTNFETHLQIVRKCAKE